MSAELGKTLFIISMILMYIGSSVVSWKMYDYFNTTFFSALNTTGFQYHFKKFISSLFIVPIVATFLSSVPLATVFLPENPSNHDIQKNNDQSSKSTELIQSSQKENSTPNTPVDQSNSQANSINQKNLTSEEIQALEEKVQYHGDDPVIRERLGLPPKKAD
jgi:hypothetical protein